MKYTSNGKAMLKVNFAVDKAPRDGEKQNPIWLTVTLWEKRAEALQEYIRKGTLIGVAGQLDVREYEKKDGTRGISVEVAYADVKLLGGKNDATTGRAATAKSQQIADEDVPF
jgi:single-strand DNA-binding protein